MNKAFETFDYKIALREVLDTLKDCISDLEYEESDGWMSGQVYADYYKKALEVISKYKDE